MDIKAAKLGHPVHELISTRWSPYAFQDRPVAKSDLVSLFEAARWAPSSYNEQPWTYIVASKEMSGDYQNILSCLVEANQAWAKAAPVLALGVVNQNFARNNAPNRAAMHDLGLASANLSLEATARGLSVHQMIGLDPDKARQIFSIPEGSEALTALAIGYRADPSTLAESLRARDLSPRERKPLSKFVFSGKWGTTSKLVAD